MRYQEHQINVSERGFFVDKLSFPVAKLSFDQDFDFFLDKSMYSKF